MYVKTIVVTEEILHRIQIGDIVLTPGQWIRLAWLNQRSRYVGVTPKAKVFYGVHQHRRGAFKIACENFKRQAQRQLAN